MRRCIVLAVVLVGVVACNRQPDTGAPTPRTSVAAMPDYDTSRLSKGAYAILAGRGDGVLIRHSKDVADDIAESHTVPVGTRVLIESDSYSGDHRGEWDRIVPIIVMEGEHKGYRGHVTRRELVPVPAQR